MLPPQVSYGKGFAEFRRPVRFLVLDDDAALADLLGAALSEAGIGGDVQWAATPDEAFDGALAQGRFLGEPKPDVIVASSSLLRAGGLDLLRALKGDNGARVIPVVIIADAMAPDARRSLYSQHAASVISRPPTRAELGPLASTLATYWGRINQSSPGP